MSGVTACRHSGISEVFKLREQAQRVHSLADVKQLVLLVRRQDSSGQQALHRGLGSIIGPTHATAISLFRLQFHGWLKRIDIHAQGTVEFGQLSVCQLPDKTVIADHLPDNVAVLLLNIALIIALLGTPAADR
jgi:hypothetical protein